MDLMDKAYRELIRLAIVNGGEATYTAILGYITSTYPNFVQDNLFKTYVVMVLGERDIQTKLVA